ncbi:MAG TPA: fused MFS/spermidine synthase [Methylomirabilota bacterium]|nr:fused MFS/spermidine synthase [Methylomirabilota bacterium]
MSRRPGAGVIYLCFFLSGATGLVYEVLWSRMLGLIFGHTAHAVVTVLAVFMAGLALGSFLFSRLLGRIRRLIRAYGWLEIGIGVSCAALPLLLSAVAAAYLGLHAALGLSYGAFSLVQFLLVGAVLLLPTTLMGGTLPVLSQALAQEDRGIGGTVGALYAVNTFGAVAGVTWAGYLGLPALGIRTTLAAAAVANVAVGLLALAYDWATRGEAGASGAGDQRQAESASQPAPARPPAAEEADPASGAAGSDLVLAAAALALSGAVSMVYEVGWTRALSQVIGSSTYAFTAMLVAFLIGIAAGSALYSRIWGRRAATLGTLGRLQLGIAGTGTVALVVFPRTPEWVVAALAWSGAPGLLEAVQLGVSTLLLLPLTLFVGATFPCAVAVGARSAARVGKDVGLVYALNTLGAIAGTVAAGFVLLPAWGAQGSLTAGVWVNLALAAALFALDGRRGRIAARLGLGLAAAVGVGVVVIGPWDLRALASGPAIYADTLLVASAETDLRQALRRHRLLYYHDGLSATVSVTQLGDTLALRSNGKVEATNTGDMPTQLMVGHLPMLLHREPTRVLIIGLGSGITAAAVARYPAERIDIVEIEPAMVEASQFFADANQNVLSDPRVRLVTADARNFLLTTRERYDVIISQPSNPWISGVASLFTVEFFELARGRLRPGGTMTAWVQTYAFWPQDLQMVMGTFLSVFPTTSVWNPVGGDLVLVGRAEPGPLDLGRVRARYEALPGVREDLARSGIGDWPGILGIFLLADGNALRYAGGAPLHTDDRLELEFSAPRALYYRTAEANMELLGKYRPPGFPEIVGADSATLDGAPARRWIGEAALRRRGLDDAVAHFGRVLAQDPANVPALLGLARALFELGRAPEAMDAAQRALGRAPRNAEALFLAGSFATRLGRQQDALGYLEQAVALEPANRQYRDTLGRVKAAPPAR